MQYRREIDGLRAVAIVPVVLFHAGFDWFKGGFVGVDVFFVISGYLITSLVVLEREAGTFSIASFYERRARRILPPLFAMVITCIPFAWFWMTPSELKNFGQAVVALSLFVSNFLFFAQHSYFSPSADLQPLLHTWTLAVEEQYYILFPVFVILFWRFGRLWFGCGIALVALSSFALAHLGIGHNAGFPIFGGHFNVMPRDSGFYLTPMRAWELMLGSLVAAFLPGGSIPHGKLSEAASAIGLAAILFAVFRFDKDTPFPSYYTLVPTLGATLIVAFATSRTIVGRLLGQPVFVGIGLISYSLYIWHQPIFAFARLHDPVELQSWLLWLLIGASFGIAWLSWRYIEQSFRNRANFTRNQIFAIAGTTSMACICIGAYFVIANGVVERFPLRDRYLVGIEPIGQGDYVVSRFNALDHDFIYTRGEKKILILGDSFAQDFVNMAFENNALSEYQIRTYYIPAKCQIIIPEPDKAECRIQSTADPILLNRLRQADIVIVAAAWSADAAQALKGTLRAMGLKASQTLFVLGRKDFGLIRPTSYLRLSHRERLAHRNPVAPLAVNAMLRATFPTSEFIDVEQLVCGDSGTCPVFAPNEKLISFDRGHLTKDGAKFIGHIIFGRSALRTLTAENAK